MRVADHERHRHRFAERAAETEHDAADDAGPRERQHDLVDHFPGRAAEGVGRLFQCRRHGFKHIARDRSDVRQHHDAENDAGGEHADAVGRPGEQRAQERHAFECGDDQRLHVQLQKRREHKQAPDAVDDARNAGEQLDRGGDRPLERARAQLGNEDRDADGDRNADNHGNDRRDDGAVDRRERAELLGHRVPFFGGEKAEAERLERQPGAVDQGNDDAAQQQQHRDRRGARGVAQDRIPQRVPPQRARRYVR